MCPNCSRKVEYVVRYLDEDKFQSTVNCVCANQCGYTDVISNCPFCQSDLIDDVWDLILEVENGDFILDAFYAWVCEKRCGFFVRKD